MVSQIDILENLKGSSDEYQHVILGTYSFDPDFFEEKILRVLRSKGAETILVLTDKREYQDKFSAMSQAGQDYHIDYCYASHTFHPKFILLVSPNTVKLVLGSANLKKEAWFESGEVIGSITYDFSKYDSESEKILSDFRDFISKILNKNYVKSKKHRQKLSQAIEKLPISIDNKNVNVKLIHNVERPILHQVRDIIDEPIESVKIVAPFFNVEGSIFDFFSEMGCESIQIFIQPESVEGFPKRKITQMNSNGAKITVSSIAFKDQENRYIHAKIMILKTSTKEFCLYGSANPTFSGMLSTPAGGNLELCVLSGSRHERYGSLIENNSMVIIQIDMEQVKDADEKQDIKSESRIIDIEDAYLDGRKLNLELSKPSGSSSIVLGHVDGASLDIPFSTQEKRFHVDLNEKQFGFCSKPTYVQVLFQKHHPQAESRKRWISTQTLELTPRRVDVERILQTHGSSGLILFLNKLKKLEGDSQWFYYFLTILRFEDLGTLESIRRRLAQRKQEIEVEDEYKKPPEINLKAIFERKFEKTNKSIQESLRQMDEFDQGVFENQFELFLTCSRFIFWLTQEKPKSIDHLRFIRINIEAFLKMYDKFKQNRDFVNYLNKNNFWQHLLLLSFLMLSFQKKAGFWKDNPGVVKVFNETITCLIGRFENKSKLAKEDFDPVVKIYSEFENLEIDLNKMDRFYAEEFSKKIF